MPSEYTLSELAKLSGVSSRTVRFYIAQGLLPSPTQLGPNARYTETHLDRLRLIRKLQGAHLPLAEIRKQLGALPPEQVTALADSEPAHGAPADSALDYIESLLRPSPATYAMRVAPAAAPARIAAPASIATSAPQPSEALAAPPPTSEKSTEPDRSQWERISLDPDIELHIRRPLTRQHNRRVERLISIARQLLEED